MAEIQNNVYKNPEVSQKLKKMFNKPKYSDSVFLVNQTKFHASSHLVSVSCRELETMLDDHFENCGDREVKIGPIKHEDSFSVILKDIYGLEINFSELSKDVLCEVLWLSEQYELSNLFNELKLFLSNLDQFEVESVVSLLNTASKYEFTDLFEKVKMYSFENSEQLVKHESFSNLKYDMLLGFISSDWFAADEINILTSSLTWHSSNINSPDDIEKTMVDNNGGDIIQEDVQKENTDSREEIEALLQPGRSGDISDNFGFNEETTIIIQEDGQKENTDSQEEIEALLQPGRSGDIPDNFGFNEETTVIFQEDVQKENTDSQEEIEALLQPGSSGDISDSFGFNEETTIPTESNNEEVLKTFSEKILISILSHIRFELISIVKIHKFWKSELYSRYKEFLDDLKHVSPISEPRKKYIDQKPVCETERGDFNMNFTVMANIYYYINESNEEHQVEGMKWKVCAMYTDKNKNGTYLENVMRRLEVYLKCTSLDNCNWECKVECEIKLISVNPEQAPTQYLTVNKTFTPENSQLLVGSFYFPCHWTYRYYDENSNFNYEVCFKSIRKLNKCNKYIDQKEEYKMELVTSILTVKASDSWNEFFESNEECHSGGLQWKICVIYTGTHMNEVDLANGMRRLDVYLKCISLDNCNRQCKVECEIKLISGNPDKAPTQYLTVYKTFTPESKQLQVGNFYFPFAWKYTYCENWKFNFEVCFKSIPNLNA